MKNRFVLLFGLFLSANAMAAGIDCNTLPQWSASISGYQVNQHHVFCGEPASGGSAKGFHSMPNGDAPSTYLSSTPLSGPNAAGIYTLQNINLKFGSTTYVKSMSSMFPNTCTQAQVNNSIVYSLQNATGNCANPSWAKCGPNAPPAGGAAYCVAKNGSTYQIATALLSGTKKINTGFPIFVP